MKIELAGLEVDLKHAQEVKKELLALGILNNDSRPIKKDDSIVFPLRSKEGTEKLIEKYNTKLIISEFELIDKTSYKDKLKEIDTNISKSAYDVIGNIAILEIDEVDEEKEISIASLLLQTNKKIKTVLKKAGPHEGELRIQGYKFLAGVNTTETTHIENGTRIRLDIASVYYSPRSATERLRIANLVKKDETVLVMFSGCGPFPCVIARNSEPKSIVGIEKNENGHEYANINKKLNKITNLELFCGDVKEIIPKIQQKFDRIVMPLPMKADLFLETAILAAKDSCTLHIYQFLKDEEHEEAKEKVTNALKELSFDVKSVNIVKCGQQSPYTFRVCLDVEIQKA